MNLINSWFVGFRYIYFLKWFIENHNSLYQQSFSVYYRSTQPTLLTPVGTSVVDMQVAGRWKSSQMPAHYAKAELAERGAIAGFKDGKR